MQKFFLRPEERSFTIAVARARFLWLLVAALLLPIAASLSQGTDLIDPAPGSQRLD